MGLLLPPLDAVGTAALARLAETVGCPIAWAHECAGTRHPSDCGCWREVIARCDAGDHRYCGWTEGQGCSVKGDLLERVVPVGLAAATGTRPFAVVTGDGTGGYRVVGTFANVQAAKPARTRASAYAGGLAVKTDAWVVCGRCGDLH